MISHGWNLKYGTNEPICKMERLLDRENRIGIDKVEGGGRGMAWVYGVGRCKLSHLKWINNKVLMYITENYIQYLVINHNGKKYKREYICLQLSHSSNNTREDSTRGHHQTVNTKIRLIILFAAKDGEALYTQQNKTRS